MDITTEVHSVRSFDDARTSLRHLARATASISSSAENLGLLVRLTSLAHPLGFEGEVVGGSFFTDQLVELRELGYLTFDSGVVELVWKGER